MSNLEWFYIQSWNKKRKEQLKKEQKAKKTDKQNKDS